MVSGMPSVTECVQDAMVVDQDINPKVCELTHWIPCTPSWCLFCEYRKNMCWN